MSEFKIAKLDIFMKAEISSLWPCWLAILWSGTHHLCGHQVGDYSPQIKQMSSLPARARVSWCSWGDEKRMLGLMSFVVKFSHGGVKSVCLSVESTSISTMIWKSWGYFSGESHASSSGLKIKSKKRFEDHLLNRILSLSVVMTIYLCNMINSF